MVASLNQNSGELAKNRQGWLNFLHKSYFMKLLFLSTVICALGITLTAKAGQLDTIRQSRAITVAHREASIPFSYFDDQKRPIGYAMDICAKIVSALERELKIPNLQVNYLPVTSASRLTAIAEGKAAMECGSTTNTAERRKLVDYTVAHFISSAKFLVRKDSGIEKLEDLTGKTVVSTKGTTNIKTLDRINTERLLNLKVLEAQDHSEAFGMVANKKADAFAMDDVLLFGLRANSADPAAFKVIGKPMTIEPYAIVLPKGDSAFKKVVDTEMRRMILSGEIYIIYRKWFEQPIAPKGINLALPMPYMLRDSFKYPSDKVADLVN
jgi:ABC-type amino acid transport substrate-binding protein